MIVDWLQFKNFVDSRNTDILMVEDINHYHVYTSENALHLECDIDKSPSDETDLTEFETNYLPSVNPKRTFFDQSGKPFARFAIATEGMILQCLTFNFKTADKDSLYCKQPDNITNKGYHTLKMYDVNGNETQTNSSAVLTTIDYEPPYDYEMVGGHVFQKQAPTSNIYAYLVALPDIPVESGGSHSMCGGGFNLAMIDKTYKIDGRAPKMLYFSPYHTNKLRFYFYHEAGYQHEIQFALECYK